MSRDVLKGDAIFLVDLDALLDTRLGVLASLSHEAFAEVIRNPEYAVREDDDLSRFTDKVTREQFLDAWKNRNEECLLSSYITNILHEIKRLTFEVAEVALKEKDPRMSGDCYVDINYYGYKLSKEVTDELCLQVSKWCYPGTTVKAVDIHPAWIRLAYLEQNYTHYFVYSMKAWLAAAVGEDYQGPPAKGVTIVAPALFDLDHADEKQELRREDFKPNEVFGLAELGFANLMCVKYQDPYWFSMMTPMKGGSI